MKSRVERPLGISILAIVFGILGILLVIPAIMASAGIAGLGPSGVFLAMLTLLVPEGLVIGAIGLWRMRRWGRIVTIATLVILDYTYFVSLIEVGLNAWTLLRLLFPVALIVYLARPSMRAKFA